MKKILWESEAVPPVKKDFVFNLYGKMVFLQGKMYEDAGNALALSTM